MDFGGTDMGTMNFGGMPTGAAVRRRTSSAPTIRLAAGFSMVAASVAVVLDSVGDVSRPGMAATVAAVGFAASWVQSGRHDRTVDRSSPRLAVVPLRHPVG